MKNTFIACLLPAALALVACNSADDDYDASGSFESVERIISAEATGKILELDVEEGQVLQAGQEIGRIDVTLLRLQSEQIESTIDAIHQKQNEAGPQVRILEAQLVAQSEQVESLEREMAVLDREIDRFDKLVEARAAPQKQLDDLEGQRSVMEKKLEAARSQSDVIRQQIRSTRSATNIQNRAILSEVAPTQKRLQVLEQQIRDGLVVNEYPGTVLVKYAYDGEFTAIGKPLYKIADLSTVILRCYITGTQLTNVRLGDTVTVMIDDGEGGYLEREGRVEWIADKAEFTPKTIQTKDERENLVYAMKVKVPNDDGRYKIGMYGQIKFRDHE